MRAPDSQCGIYIRWFSEMGPLGDYQGPLGDEGTTAAVATIHSMFQNYAALEQARDNLENASQIETARIEAMDSAPIKLITNGQMEQEDEAPLKQVAEALASSLTEDRKRWPETIEVYAIGIPWPKDQGGPIVDRLQRKIDEAGLSQLVKVRKVRRPSSTGLARIYEEIVYFAFPIPSEDYDKPTKAETKTGWQSFVTSSGITMTLQTAFFGLTGFASAVMNGVFSYVTTFNRPTWNNYYAKHKTSAEAWIRQFWMNTYFGAGIYWATKFFSGGTSDVFKVLTEMATLSGWSHYFVSKLHSNLIGTGWRKPLETGSQLWIQKEAAEGRGEEARAIAATIRKWATIFSTNMWAFSLILSEATSLPLFTSLENMLGVNLSWLGGKVSILAWDFNLGHVGLIFSAAVFGTLAKYPEYYRLAEQSFRREKWAKVRAYFEKLWIKIGEGYVQSAPPYLP